MRFKINTYITLLLCFLLGGNVFSQAFFNAGGTVYVQDEAELWITGNDGDVEVATVGVFYNPGRLFIEGDWTNKSGSTPFLHNSIYKLLKFRNANNWTAVFLKVPVEQ